MSVEATRTLFGAFGLACGIVTVSALVFHPLRLRWREPDDAALLVSISVGASVAILALASLGSLLLGHLRPGMIAYLGASILGVPFALRSGWFKFERGGGCGSRPALPSLWWLVAMVPPAGLAFTPVWDFMIASGMDAGNYEIVSSHFAHSGSFWFDGRSSVALAGGELDWVYSPGNTWSPSAGAVGRSRPYYFPLYPALLGAFKFVLSDMSVGSVLNLLLGSLGAFSLYGLLRHLRLTPPVAALGASLSSLTTLYMFYSKQTMSELLALVMVLGVLASLTVLGSPRKRGGGSGWLVFGLSGLFVLSLLLTKLDAIQPLLLVAAVSCVLAARSMTFDHWWRGCFVATLAGGLIVSAIAVPSYLAHARLPIVLPVVGDLAGRRFFVAAGLGLLGTRLVAGFVAHALRVGGRWRSAFATGRAKVRQLIPMTVASGMALFVVWLLLIRPLGVDIETDVNALNAIRLGTLWSPVLLASVFLAMATQFRGLAVQHRLVALALSIALAMLLVDARHSAPDLWWMRRYVMVAVPLGLFAFGSVVRGLDVLRTICSGTARHLVSGLAIVAVVASFGFQLFMVIPVLGERQNPGVARDVLTVAAFDPDATLHAVAWNRGFVGFANAVRSHRSAPTLVAIHPEDFESHVSAIERESLLLIPTSWEERFANSGKVVLRGYSAGDWADWHRELAAERSPRLPVRWSLIRVG